MKARFDERTKHELTTLFIELSEDVFRRACILTQGDRETAHDLLQETFHSAALSWDTVRNYENERRRKWLFKVLRNKWVDSVRSDVRRQKAAEGITPADTAGETDPTAEYAFHALALDKVVGVMKGMPAARHKVAILRWGEGWTAEEIAERLGISASTVRVHLKNARDEVLKAVGDDLPLLPGAGRAGRRTGR